LRRALARPGGSLIVVYGRRRCGKSRLLQEALRGHPHGYYVADLSAAGIQRQALAAEAERVVPGFAAASYPDWAALLETWCARAPDGVWLLLDELPYLVQVSPELPSIIQKLIDAPRTRPPRLLLCGSSQRMMHGLVLDETAPLYGRAAEIIKVTPMPPEALRDALQLDAEQSVVAYSIWGGLPRNWELAADYGSTAEALRALILDRNGVLHGEPSRLLLDDMRSVVQANSLLALIGSGCRRISEIGGRVGQPATSLNRPLGRLIDLGYVRRELRSVKVCAQPNAAGIGWMIRSCCSGIGS
jgi:AAA+ ATPase superfamily predicted ATPase